MPWFAPESTEGFCWTTSTRSSELHVADCGTRVEPVPSRRVVLVPGSPDDTPRSIQDRSASNRFSVLGESDAEDGQPQHHDIGTPPPTADEGGQ